MKNRILGLSGKKRSGKDTFYQILNSMVMAPKVGVRRYAFADEVKVYAQRYFGFPTNPTDEQKEAQRFVLQGIGQMMREEVNKDYWVNVVLNQIKSEREEFNSRGVSHIAVITDLRYLNEAEAISELGEVVRLVRPDFEDSSDTHPSEVELDSYSFSQVVVNSGGKMDYINNIRGWVKKWNLRK